MPHVRSEGGQSGIDILPITIPFKKTMAGEGVANIMDTGSVLSAFVYPTLLKKLTESVVYRDVI